MWAWIGEKLSNPVELRRELENRQSEREAELAPLRQRLTVIDDLLSDNQGQLGRLLDLYLKGDFPREILTERKARLETTIEALERERRLLAAALQERTLTPDDYQSIEGFARDIGRVFAAIGSDDFEAKRALVERLAIEVRLGVESGEMIARPSSPVLGEGRCRLRLQAQTGGK